MPDQPETSDSDQTTSPSDPDDLPKIGSPEDNLKALPVIDPDGDRAPTVDVASVPSAVASEASPPQERQACPACGETAPAAASWCEACGADLGAAPAEATAAAPCVSCDAPPQEITTDQYCMRCGHKQPSPRDHLVADEGSVAGVSDKGKRHHHNEDSFGIARFDEGVVLVVCDGVSSTYHSEEASQRAADTAVEQLGTALTYGSGDISSAMVDAVAAAHQSVTALPAVPGGQDPPSCTFVAVVAETPSAPGNPAKLTVGWLGDSRAYLLVNGTAKQLTVDHSWGLQAVAAGEVTEEEARNDPRAHSITRWIGDDAINLVPDIEVAETSLPCRVLLCTDGLWNYAPTEDQLAEAAANAAGSPAETAEALTALALDRGGHDNITVVIADLQSNTSQEEQ